MLAALSGNMWDLLGASRTLAGCQVRALSASGMPRALPDPLQNTAAGPRTTAEGSWSIRIAWEVMGAPAPPKPASSEVTHHIHPSPQPQRQLAGVLSELPNFTHNFFLKKRLLDIVITK